MNETILVTGGAGFIGSNFVLNWLSKFGTPVLTVDKLTYAGNRANLASLDHDSRHRLVCADISDTATIGNLLHETKPRAVVHFAAESHVDRSISGPAEFIQTNILGTFYLLEQAKSYWSELSAAEKDHFRFLHVSTDEVYGSLDVTDPAFTEKTPYAPNSPYAASKAASDHLVRSYFHTFGLPVLTTNCSNNYGPYQFPEKLIPLMILNALEGKPLPVYGDGQNVRDWLFVEDHCDAIVSVLKSGKLGETYNIGGASERKNLDVVATVCDVIDQLRPEPSLGSRRSLITFVKDRPGHDRRYAVDANKIRRELGWQPRERFETGIRRTIEWYLSNLDWVENIRSGAYHQWIEQNYSERLAK